MIVGEPIQHESNADVVRMRIDLASADMLVREFTMNAIEATKHLPAEDVDIRWDFDDWNGTPKLRMWNNGTGMDPDELVANMNIGRTGGEKQQGLDQNFGVGAKVTGLKANPAGIVYHSCKDSQVTEVWLRWDENRNAVLNRYECNDRQYAAAIDVSDQYRPGDLAEDWTAVLFIGQSEDHNTFESNFDGTPQTYYQRLKDINTRFWDLAANPVRVRTMERDRRSKSKQPTGVKIAQGLKAQPMDLEEDIDLGNGIVIRYAVIMASPADKNYGYTNHICIVHKGEIYSMVSGGKWTSIASRFGVPWAANEVVIQVHLADDYPVSPEMYRTRLQRIEGMFRETIDTGTFEEAVVDSRPEWFIEWLADREPEAREQRDNHKRRLQRLLKSIVPPRPEATPDNDGTDASLEEPGSGAEDAGDDGDEGRGGGEDQPDRKTRVIAAKGVKSKMSDRQRRASLPRVSWERGGTANTDGELSERAGRYDYLTHAIFLNEDFEVLADSLSFVMTAKQLRREMRTGVLDSIKDEMEYLAVRHVLMALNYHGRRHWNTAQWESTLTPEALTVALSAVDHIRSQVQQRLRGHGAARAKK